MKRDVKIYLKDIIEYMKRAEDYVKNMNYDEFYSNQKTCDAVIRCIEVIGEATKNIPEEIREKYPSIPWRDMAGMRDKVIHAYFTVDFEEVWFTIKDIIPKIKPLVEQVLNDFGEDKL